MTDAALTDPTPIDPVLAQARRRRLALPGAGVEIALLEWQSDAPLALLHHANGFCGALFAPLVERLRPHFHVVAMDARGHGDSSLPPEGAVGAAFSWDVLRDDLLAVARALLAETGRERIALGLGHSFGGTLMLASEGSAPGLFERLLLLDPVILPAMTREEAQAHASDVGLAERARRRRAVFASRQQARAHFGSRELFRKWLPRALDLYVNEALRARRDGQVELKCPGAVEACIFEGAHTLDVAGLAAHVDCPVEIVWASQGNFPREVYEELTKSMPRARVVAAETGHLIPMEKPEIASEAALREVRTAEKRSGPVKGEGES